MILAISNTSTIMKSTPIPIKPVLFFLFRRLSYAYYYAVIVP